MQEQAFERYGSTNSPAYYILSRSPVAKKLQLMKSK